MNESMTVTVLPLQPIPFVVAFLIALLSGPKIIAHLRKLKAGQVIQSDGPEAHRSKAGTPAMGGLIILLGFTASVLLVLLLGRPDEMARMGLILALVIAYAAIGFADDWLTVRPRGDRRGIGSKPKFLLQLLAAIGFVAYASYAGYLRSSLSLPWGQIDLGWFYLPFAVLIISAMVNFVNITDGLDGLAAGLTVILCLSLSLFAGFGIAWLFAGLAGACAAFLIFNFNPAKVFMGDTGSLAIGAALSAAAVLYHVEIVIIVASMVFILDGLSSALQWAVFKYTRIRTGTGRRVFKMSPVHHHFELSGWSERKVVYSFWAAGLVFAVVTMLLARWIGHR